MDYLDAADGSICHRLSVEVIDHIPWAGRIETTPASPEKTDGRIALC